MVGMVFQNPENQIVASTVEEDVAFGLENNNLTTQEINQRVSDQLVLSGLTQEAKRPPHFLSGGQIQKLALAGVLARQPRIILFDEPTSMLDPATREDFLRRLRNLQNQGKTIIFSTHHMEEVVIADQVVVLHEGQVCLKGSPFEVFERVQYLHEMGLEIPSSFYLAQQLRALGLDVPVGILTASQLINSLPEFDQKLPVPRELTEKKKDREIINVDNVHYTYLAGTPLAQPALKGVNLSVSEQHIHGMTGTNGSGKSTLLQHLNGILRPEKGHIQVAHIKIEDPNTPLHDIVRKVGMVFQNPESQFFEVYVGDEIAYGPKQFKMNDIRNRVQQAMTLVELDFNTFKDRRLETLSGGEKRKVALASTLVLNQDILLFDEPTAGMDPRSCDVFLNLFSTLQKEGKTIVIATHQLDDLAQIAQSLSIMKDGQVLRTAAQKELLFDTQAISQGGLLLPIAVRISKKLIEQGWPIDGLGTTTPARLLQAIRKVVA